MHQIQERKLLDIAVGEVGFYRPDPSGPHAVNVALMVTSNTITVYEVRTQTQVTMHRTDWMPLAEMESSLVDLVVGVGYLHDAAMRNRILTGRIKALADAVRAKDLFTNVLTQSVLSEGPSR